MPAWSTASKEALTSGSPYCADLGQRYGHGESTGPQLPEPPKGAGSAVAVRQDAITTAMTNTQKDIDQAQVRLDATERTLRARFANLESLIAQLQQTGSALQSQLASLSGINSSSKR